MRRKSHQGSYWFVFIAAAAALIVFIAWRQRVESLFFTIAGPVQGRITTTLRNINDTIIFYSSLGRIYDDNKRLSAAVAKLQSEQEKCADIEQENKRLRQMLDFKAASSPSSIAAQVTGINISNWFSSVIIDKGSKDGIKPRNPVITDTGAAGYVESASKSTSRIRLLTSGSCRVAVMIKRTLETCLLKGADQAGCTLEFIDPHSQATAGDIVVTSRTSTLFPEHIRVGVITTIDQAQAGFYKTAQVEPCVALSKLDYVFVLQWEPPSSQ